MSDAAADIAALWELQQRRKDYIKTINANTNRARAFVSRAIGWNPNDDEEARKKVSDRAAAVVAKAFAGKGCDVPGVEADLEVLAQSIEPLERMRHGVELEMKRVARRLPVYPWAKAVRGFGELGLAVIVGECGDLSEYANPAKVWKRCGLAPFEKNGVSMAASTWRAKGGLDADDWTTLGYSPHRRAEMFAVIGDPLFRQQTMIMGPYRIRYDSRRARTAETHQDWAKKRSHFDALRVMTKELLRDLWAAWNGEADAGVKPTDHVPPHQLAEAQQAEAAG